MIIFRRPTNMHQIHFFRNKSKKVFAHRKITSWVQTIYALKLAKTRYIAFTLFKGKIHDWRAETYTNNFAWSNRISSCATVRPRDPGLRHWISGMSRELNWECSMLSISQSNILNVRWIKIRWTEGPTVLCRAENNSVTTYLLIRNINWNMYR